MNTFIVLLRGINVGGKNLIRMKDLASALEGIGGHDVKTYLQSGNASFRTAERDRAKLSRKLGMAIRKSHGFEPDVFILTLRDLERAIAKNPFPDAEGDPAGLHVGFLATVPGDPDLEQLQVLKKSSERFRLIGSVFYLHAPEGIGRSKLAAGSERLLGVRMTDRNWRTVCRIREMAGG